MTNDLCLALPDESREFHVFCAASHKGLLCTLSQTAEDGQRPVAFASRLLHLPEKTFCFSELHCLAVLYAVKKFSQHLKLNHFVIETDHVAIKNLITLAEPSNRVSHWVKQLTDLNCTITSRKDPTKHAVNTLSEALCATNNKLVKSCAGNFLPENFVVEDRRLNFAPGLWPVTRPVTRARTRATGGKGS